MGMFDTLNFRCPVCGETTSFQSKWGPCELANYTLEDAPLIVIADANYDGNNGKLFCESCDTKLKLQVVFSTVVIPYDPSTTNESSTRII